MWGINEVWPLLSIAAHHGPLHSVDRSIKGCLSSYGSFVTHASLSTAPIRGDDSWYEAHSSINPGCFQTYRPSCYSGRRYRARRSL